MSHLSQHPARTSYDVVIIGGAMMGSSVAWWLSHSPDFQGRILVVERDPTYAQCSTAHTNSCIRQQFSEALNVRISQFTAEFIKNLRANMGGDLRVDDLSIQEFGYLYLADSEPKANALRAAQVMQNGLGARTRIMTKHDLARDFPFYQLDDILLGSHGARDEGYWDGGALFDWFRRKAVAAGVEYVNAEVTGIEAKSTQVTSVTLSSGHTLTCGHLVNAAGPRAGHVAVHAVDHA